MSTPIENYLPNKKGPTRPVQGNVDVKLFAKVDKFRKSNDVTWSELISAMFERLIDESGKKKP